MASSHVNFDDDLRKMLRDPRYVDNWRPGSAAYRAAVTRAWEDRYPSGADATGHVVNVRAYDRSVTVGGTLLTQHVRDYTQTRQGRGDAGARNPSSVDSFFERMHEPLSAMAGRLAIPPHYVLGLSSYESGWLDTHNAGLNNPFGLTRAGGNNLRFDSIEAAIRYWEDTFGSQIRGATSPEDFADRLLGLRNGQRMPGWRVYNTANPQWRSNIVASIRTVQRRLPMWRQQP